MKVENIHIDGFGIWTDKSWESLDPCLNVFHGLGRRRGTADRQDDKRDEKSPDAHMSLSSREVGSLRREHGRFAQAPARTATNTECDRAKLTAATTSSEPAQ